MKLPQTFLIACLGTAPLCAQQTDPHTTLQQAEPSRAATGEASAHTKSSDSASANADASSSVRTETRGADAKPHRRPPQSNPPNQSKPSPTGPEQRPVAYIGVLTREVPPELRSQFSLPEGFGLMVDEVMPDSPGKAAGLKRHDVLVKFEEQQLVNMEQLMALVRAQKQGTVVNLVVITGGKEITVPVTLGERLIATNEPRGQQSFGGWPQHGMPFFRGDAFRGFDNPNQESNEPLERLQKELRDYQERIQDWTRQGNKGPIPQPPMLNTPGNKPTWQPRDGGRGPGHTPERGTTHSQTFNESHATMNITRRDDAGEYTLKRDDGQTTFTVRPNNGKEQSWPVNNDTERQAVPEEFRDKLRMMEGAGGGVRMEVKPGKSGTSRESAPQRRSTST